MMNFKEMTKGENICNAFKVVKETQKSLDGLRATMVDYCSPASNLNSQTNYNHYDVITDKGRFLRYSSDTDSNGWCYGCLILLFKRRINPGNDVFVFAVDFMDCEEPTVTIGKMRFGQDVGRDISIADYFKYMYPLYAWNTLFEYEKDTILKLFANENLLCKFIRVKDGKYKKDSDATWYNNFQRAVVINIPLLDITRANYAEKIFGAMDVLDKIPL